MNTSAKLFITLSAILSVAAILVFTIPQTANAQYYNYNNCAYHAYQQCVGQNLYWYDSCGRQQDFIQYCSNNNYGNHAYQRCVGNSYLYWYDSYGNQQDLFEYCPNNCYNNSCEPNNYNNYNNYNNCTYHAYKLCVGNSIYWYNSCGNQQDLYYSCAGGQTCQYGQCTIAYIPPVQNYSNYSAYYGTTCYNNSLYWYDSLGVFSGLYKNCSDSNSCTADACSGDKCSNTIKCDGSTCANGSADYNKYCSPIAPSSNQAGSQTSCGNGLCETTLGETTANCPSDCKIGASTGLVISFFVKHDLNANQWDKTAEVGPDSRVYFMISATNNSTVQINNATVLADIHNEIASLGNLKVDEIAVSGDIVSGVNIGSIAPAATKLITFEGKTDGILSASTKQATATGSISGTLASAGQSDSVSIKFNPDMTAAAVSSASSTSGFLGFLKRWYLWILVGLVLVFLFVVVFRRLSSNT